MMNEGQFKALLWELKEINRQLAEMKLKAIKYSPTISSTIINGKTDPAVKAPLYGNTKKEMLFYHEQSKDPGSIIHLTGLSIRTKKSIFRNGISTINQLQEIARDANLLRSLDNVGVKTADEITKALTEHGRDLF